MGEVIQFPMDRVRGPKMRDMPPPTPTEAVGAPANTTRNIKIRAIRVSGGPDVERFYGKFVVGKVREDKTIASFMSGGPTPSFGTLREAEIWHLREAIHIVEGLNAEMRAQGAPCPYEVLQCVAVGYNGPHVIDNWL